MSETPLFISSKSSQLNISRLIVAVLALVVSLVSLKYFFQIGGTNIYGDGLAHLDIARKMVDLDTNSLWERYAQLGSPWLPIPHLIMLPFIWQDYLWRSGLAGSIASICCYLISVMICFEIGAIFGGILRSDRSKDLDRNSTDLSKDRVGNLSDLLIKPDRISGLVAALIFALNPSLLYLQTTPMTELPFLAVFLAAIWLLLKWALNQRISTLLFAGLITALATITRYEAWALLPTGAIVVFIIATRKNFIDDRLAAVKIGAKKTLIWSAVAVSGPIYWLWHNWATYKNPLEFYNGFYSAKGIYLRNQARLGWFDFVIGNIGLAALVALLTAMACIGIMLLFLFISSSWRISRISFQHLRQGRVEILPILLLALPFCFIIYSLYSGNIQIYPLSAFSLLNVRYGVTIMPALAVFPIVWLSGSRFNIRLSVILLLVLAQYGWILSAGPMQLAVFQEPYRNNCNTREARARTKLAAFLRAHPVKRKVMLCHGSISQIIAGSGLNFRDIYYVDPNNKIYFPDDIHGVIMKDSEPLWQQLKDDQEFLRNFQMVYSVGPSPQLMVWRRR